MLHSILACLVWMISLRDTALPQKLQPDILTLGEWQLISRGVDANRDGIINPDEETLSDCEGDDTYVFRVDGTASFYDNTLRCGGLAEQWSRWTLVNGSLQCNLFCASVTMPSRGKLRLVSRQAGDQQLIMTLIQLKK